eukprot:Sspe_Gene.4440::Locus_1461_Transcript_1_1_Confidence_1.000_Length_400::g.4440::m.4440
MPFCPNYGPMNSDPMCDMQVSNQSSTSSTSVPPPTSYPAYGSSGPLEDCYGRGISNGSASSWEHRSVTFAPEMDPSQYSSSGTTHLPTTYPPPTYPTYPPPMPLLPQTAPIMLPPQVFSDPMAL